jgi:hypothetical protein
MRYKALVLLALGLSLSATAIGCERVGKFSYANYERIQVGMTLTEVERLLGAPGEEIDESFVALTNVGDKKTKRVVSGDKYYKWFKDKADVLGAWIVISLKNGLVAEKYYWEPSL